MKTAAFIFLCFLCSAISVAQDINLTGTWTMFEMTYSNGQEKNTMTEDQMKSEGAVTDLFLMEGGKLKQTSNMSGSGTMDTYEGTWKFADNHLIISLKIGENLMDIVWDFEFRDNVMKLSRTAPDGSMTIINSFKRKMA